MANERLILAIGRIERTLSRLEQYQPPVADSNTDAEMIRRHEKLKSEARIAISAIDSILAGQEG
ncbi:MAG: hypothetical protein V3V15_02645 [Sphingorhabdus sp.]